MSEGAWEFRGFPPWKQNGLGKKQYGFLPDFNLMIVTVRENFM